jgi:hypothetical protein
LDPDDVAAGDVVRFRRSTPDRIVRSRRPALAELFDRDHVDHTVAALVASQEGATRKRDGGAAARKRLADAEGRLKKFQAAIAAGVDPTALVEVINAAQAERAAAQAEIDNAPVPDLMDVAEVYARIDMFGDVPAKLNDGE